MGGVRIYLLLILAVLLSGIAAILPFAWSGAEILSSSYHETAARELESNARLFSLAISESAAAMAPAEFAGVSRAARAVSDTRYTLILRDGTVVADSDEDADRMENHANRPEVRTALAGGRGIETRSSSTLGTDWMYVAVPLADGNVIRAAASMEGLNERLTLWWRKALAGFAVSLAVLVIMALFVSRMLSGPIEAAAAGAERYARGELSYRLPLAGSAEMRRLSASMGAMAGELETRFRLVNRQRQEMEVVFENMSEGLLAVDAEGHIMLVNGAAGAILRLPRDISGTGVETAVRNAELLDAIRDTEATDQSLEREIRVRRDANAESLVQVHTARMREDGRNIGVLTVLRDVTRLRQLEIMRRDFVANVSHELRTPITAIQSSLETVLEEGVEDPESSRAFVEMALRNTRRLGAIIDNLLLLAGMESGFGEGVGKPGIKPLRPVLEEAVSVCREDATARRSVLAVECPDHLTALMNPQLIVHAMTNLLDNAIKYGPEGGTIRIVAEEAGERVRVAVSDQGPGIAPRHRSRVFERFYRVDGPARIKKGSGLGLAIVKHIALSQGGEILLESEIGAGSSFILMLPRG